MALISCDDEFSLMSNKNNGYMSEPLNFTDKNGLLALERDDILRLKGFIAFTEVRKENGCPLFTKEPDLHIAALIGPRANRCGYPGQRAQLF
jgi:hypothetical protein